MRSYGFTIVQGFLGGFSVLLTGPLMHFRLLVLMATVGNFCDMQIRAVTFFFLSIVFNICISRSIQGIVRNTVSRSMVTWLMTEVMTLKELLCGYSSSNEHHITRMNIKGLSFIRILPRVSITFYRTHTGHT